MFMPSSTKRRAAVLTVCGLLVVSERHVPGGTPVVDVPVEAPYPPSNDGSDALIFGIP
jgi:hypothetical protein